MNILVRAPNWIGDQVLAYPFFFELRRRNPRAKITVVCLDWVASIQYRTLVDQVKILPRLDGLSRYERFGGLDEFALELKREGPWDLGVSLPNSFSAAWLLFRSGCRIRRGFSFEGRGLLLTDRRKFSLLERMPRAQAYLSLAGEKMDSVMATEDFFPRLPENELDQLIPGVVSRFEAATEWPTDFLISPPDEPYWVLAPGSQAESRRWPEEYFVVLARRVARETGLVGVVVGGAREAPIAERLCSDPTLRLLDRTGQGPIPVLASLFSGACFTVSNDSGLAHVSTLLGAPTFVVWGAGDPRHTKPVGFARSFLIFNPVECWPCERNSCFQPPEAQLQCLKGIQADSVFEEIRRVVRGAVPFKIEVLATRLKGRLDVLVVCLSHSWGGLEQVAASDAQEVAGLGLSVRVLCLEGSPIHQALRDRPAVVLVPLDFEPRDLFDWRLRSRIQSLVASGVTMVHSHQTSLLGSLVPWLWKHPKVALVVSRHIMNSHDKRDLFHRAMYGRVDALLAMSRALRENILATHPLPERKVHVVNLGLDFSKFDPETVDTKAQRASWGADEDTVVIGVVGRIDPAKCQDVFIKAGAGLLMKRREGEKLKFVIVGEETLGRVSNYLDELRRMVEQFRMQDDVVFAGYQENIPEVMRAFDIFVMPSRQETFGLVAIEAMAMECPIVISSGGSAAEIVGAHEEFGVLVRPRDAYDLQQKLRWLLDHPEERARMGERAREHVRSNYDRRMRLQRTLEIYERTLARRERHWTISLGRN